MYKAVSVQSSDTQQQQQEKQLYTLQPVNYNPYNPQPEGHVVLHDRRYDAAPQLQTMSPPPPLQPLRPTHDISMPPLESIPEKKQQRHHHHRSSSKPRKSTIKEDTEDEKKSLIRRGLSYWREDLDPYERKCICYAACCCICCGGCPLCPTPCACCSPCGTDCCGCCGGNDACCGGSNECMDQWQCCANGTCFDATTWPCCSDCKVCGCGDCESACSIM